MPRGHYRYQIQGPNAAKVLERLNGGPLPDVKFFNMDVINIKLAHTSVVNESRRRLALKSPPAGGDVHSACRRSASNTT